MLGCGLEPGLTEILARRLAERLDRVDELHILCGGVPERPAPPLGYKIVFGGRELPLREAPAPAVVDGRRHLGAPVLGRRARDRSRAWASSRPGTRASRRRSSRSPRSGSSGSGPRRRCAGPGTRRKVRVLRDLGLSRRHAGGRGRLAGRPEAPARCGALPARPARARRARSRARSAWKRSASEPAGLGAPGPRWSTAGPTASRPWRGRPASRPSIVARMIAGGERDGARAPAPRGDRRRRGGRPASSASSSLTASASLCRGAVRGRARAAPPRGPGPIALAGLGRRRAGGRPAEAQPHAARDGLVAAHLVADGHRVTDSQVLRGERPPQPLDLRLTVQHERARRRRPAPRPPARGR